MIFYLHTSLTNFPLYKHQLLVNRSDQPMVKGAFHRNLRMEPYSREYTQFFNILYEPVRELPSIYLAQDIDLYPNFLYLIGCLNVSFYSPTTLKVYSHQAERRLSGATLPL